MIIIVEICLISIFLSLCSVIFTRTVFLFWRQNNTTCICRNLQNYLFEICCEKNKEKVESRVVVKGFLTVMNECAGLRTWDLRELCGLIDGYSLTNKHINCYILQVTISGSWQFSFALHWRCPLMKNCLQSMLGSLLYAMHG